MDTYIPRHGSRIEEIETHRGNFQLEAFFGQPGQEHVWTSLRGMGPGKLALGFGAGLGG